MGKAGKDAAYREHLSPDFPVKGMGIQSVDQAAHQALIRSRDERKAMSSGHAMPAMAMGAAYWDQISRDSDAIHEARSIGNKGGSTQDPRKRVAGVRSRS